MYAGGILLAGRYARHEIVEAHAQDYGLVAVVPDGFFASRQEFCTYAMMSVGLVDHQEQNRVPIDDGARYQLTLAVPSPKGHIALMIDDVNQRLLFPADVGKVASKYVKYLDESVVFLSYLTAGLDVFRSGDDAEALVCIDG